MMLGLLSVSALGLAAIGVYGVLSYAVALRTTEIGIRMALGSTPVQVLGLIASNGFRTIVYGAAAGLLAAGIVTRLLSSLLFGVTIADPVAWAAAVVFLGSAAALACIIPAARASRVDPARVLAAE